MIGALRCALRCTAEAAAFGAVIIVAEELSVPSKIIDADKDATFKHLPAQRQSLQAEFMDCQAKIDAAAANKLKAIVRTRSSPQDCCEFFENLCSVEKGQDQDSQRQIPTSPVLDAFRVFHIPGDFEKTYLTFPTSALACSDKSSTFTCLMLLAHDQQFAHNKLIYRFEDLEDMMEVNIAAKLAERVSPAEAHKAYLGTCAAVGLSLSLVAAASHRLMMTLSSRGSVFGGDYPIDLGNPLGLGSVYQKVTVEFQRKKEEFLRIPWRQRSLWQHLRVDKYLQHPRVYILWHMPLLLAVAYIYKYEYTPSVKLVDVKAPEVREAENQLSSLLSKTRTRLKERLQEDEDDELLSEAVHPPYIWPGATRSDPFSTRRLFMSVVEAPIIENLFYRGLVLNRLLSMAGSSAGFGKPLAHVLAAIVSLTPSVAVSHDLNSVFGISEVEVLLPVLLHTALSQYLYVRTGSLVVPILVSSMWNWLRIEYEFMNRSDFVRADSFLSRTMLRANTFLMEPVVGQASNSFLHWRHSAYYNAVRMLNRDAPPVVSDAFIASLAKKIVKAYCSADDSPQEKGQTESTRFAGMNAVRNAPSANSSSSSSSSSSSPRLSVIDICNLHVALDRALVVSDRTPLIDSRPDLDFNRSTFDGSSVAQKRIELEYALSKEPEALRNHMGYHPALSQHLTYRGVPVSSNRTPEKVGFLEHDNKLREALRDEMMLTSVYQAIAAKYVHGLDEQGVEKMLKYLFQHCVHPLTKLDQDALEHSVLQWFKLDADLDREAFLDLMQGYFTRMNETYLKEAKVFKESFSNDLQCELVGRASNPQDRLKYEKQMRRHVEAALQRDCVAYLKTFGLTPALFSRLVRRHSINNKDVNSLQLEWTKYLQGTVWKRAVASFYERGPSSD